MNVIDTAISDVKIIEPRVFEDDRGFFFESFNQEKFQLATGCDLSFVQDNHSRSDLGVLRGLHYQLPPMAQGKLVRCAVGAIFDVAVDIRRSSKTFGSWVGVELSAENKRQLWIPQGFAHGFLTLSEVAEVLYKTTEYWNSNLERSIKWDCPELGVGWPSGYDIRLSGKDASAKPLGGQELFD
ncbi:dTDP-4-dehydrorhamnose 3,5-epimerase [Chitiniphilus purpureus]|uniref:dTDP-4-dehydrorhamnose 3,5-epimerase n=1 Tax=Chitiniphilus purpureus TaxID=2981137 RepID=A0ABY6DSK0_9NEIS|nr:dTDP-4-dehydrorhamnose 3,5-epimerase [Chitiniphilus sp. CD1]UXY17350.1 dTDP-4-dehydrorhamnose 3,5-epimerase [Chitiniphilus sp. CD1]